MKRAKDLYQKLISDENLRLAILTVNATHKWHPHHRPNKTVLRVEADIGGHRRICGEAARDHRQRI